MHADLADLVEAATVDDRECYTLLGDVRRDVGANGTPTELADFAEIDAYRGDTSDDATSLVPFLAAEIYGRLYCRSLAPLPGRTDMLVKRDFTAALSQANSGTGSWDPGWTTAGLDHDRVAVVRGEVMFWAKADQVRIDGETLHAVQPCHVRIKKEFRHFITGFYTALGEDWHGTSHARHRLVRVYWNLTTAGAVPFIALTTHALNEAAIAFRAKVLSDPALYVRADAGVLYVSREDFATCAPIIARIARELRPHLRDETPRFTKALLPGVGLAEDPGIDSFGLARSKLLACALWSCWEHGVTDPPGRLAHVADFFAACGVDPERPYLQPGSADSYVMPANGDGRRANGSPTPVPGSAAVANVADPGPVGDQVSESALLDAAEALVRELCASAVWSTDGSRCNWLGERDKDDPVLGKPSCAGSVGPDLYAGAPGVALFLAEAVGCGLSPDAAQVAAGALRRSAHQFSMGRGEPSISPMSAFAGHLGIAYVAMRLMRVAPQIDLAEECDWLLARVREAAKAELPVDLISGCAGAIPVLLMLSAEPGFESCEDLALRCGEQLVAAALWDEGTCAWAPGKEVIGTVPLTGMSHGSAGPARALLELYARTGHARCRDTARAAYAFEDACFSPAAANWVDTRHPVTGEPGDRRGRCVVAWCHGAPGIALGRGRAAMLDPERADAHRSAVRSVQPTIARVLDASLAATHADATLCHGTAGLSEVAFALGTLMGDDESTRRGVAAAGRLVAQRAAGIRWASAINRGGANPTLLIGSSGIGHHLLRVASGGEVPSVLLMTP